MRLRPKGSGAHHQAFSPVLAAGEVQSDSLQHTKKDVKT